MEPFKIEHYEREFGKGSFCPWRTLPREEAFSLFAGLKTRLQLPDSAEGLHVVKHIADNSLVLPGIDAEDDNFDLNKILHSTGLSVPESVYLNWYWFDKVDEFRTCDLARYFEWIWYPSADDTDIIDPELRWIISVSHHGLVSYMKLSI